MQIKFYVGHDKDLEDIEHSLERLILPDPKKLKNFSKQLKSIEKSLDTSSKKEAAQLGKMIKKQKSLVEKLSSRCDQLEERRNILCFAEAAEELANSSPDRSSEDVALQAQSLRIEIEKFLQNHRPSQNNAKFLRFAHLCLNKAMKKETVIKKRGQNLISLSHFQKVVVTPESFEFAEFLYELSSLLYQERIEDFQNKFELEISDQHKKELLFHITNCGGDLSSLAKRSSQLFVIQGILGYAHLLTDYFMDTTPYPTLVEIHTTFQDVDFVTHMEECGG